MDKILVWPDGGWVDASEYEAVIDAWRGDDYETLDADSERAQEIMCADLPDFE